MLQLEDHTPFVSGMFALPDARGVETLVVVIKASFELGASIRVAAEQQPLVLADAYHGSAETSSLRCASEVHPEKPGTDVLVLGDACAPRERPVVELDVAIMLADRSRRARVYGDRHWTEGFGGLQPSRPAAFVRMPCTWERAFGGPNERRNPVGRGAAGQQQAAELFGHPVPNIDDPAQPLTAWGQQPTPMGSAPLAPSWSPRIEHAGTYDARWAETRAPHLPTDFDQRYFVSAPAPQWFAQRLRGGERIAIFGMHPHGDHAFALPTCELTVDARIAGSTRRVQPELDTVIIEPTSERLAMVWRAIVPVDKQLLRVERVRVSLAAMHGASEGPSERQGARP